MFSYERLRKILTALLVITLGFGSYSVYSHAACVGCKYHKVTDFSGSMIHCENKFTCGLTGVNPDAWEVGCTSGTNCVIAYDLLPAHDHCLAQGPPVCDDKGADPVTHIVKSGNGCHRYWIFWTACYDLETNTSQEDNASGADCPPE